MDYWIVFGWEYADSDRERPFAIAEFWIEKLWSSEELAARYVARLNSVHQDGGVGDIRYAYSGPHGLDEDTF